MMQKTTVLSLLFFNVMMQADTIDIQRCFWANYQHFKGNNSIADVWFSKLFSSSVPKICYVAYIHFLFETKKFSEIYKLKDIVLNEFQSDIGLHLILAQVLATYGQDHTMHQTLIDL